MHVVHGQRRDKRRQGEEGSGFEGLRVDLLEVFGTRRQVAQQGRVCSGKCPVQRYTFAVSSRSKRRMSMAAGWRGSSLAASSGVSRSSKIVRKAPSSPGGNCASAGRYFGGNTLQCYRAGR